jgi:hypothetical protein
MIKKIIATSMMLGVFGFALRAQASSPEINSIFKKIDEAKSFFYDSKNTIVFENLADSGEKHTIDFSMNGVVLDQNNPATTDSATGMSLEYNGNLLESWLGEKNFTFKGSYKYKAANKTSYWRLGDVSEYLGDFIDLSKILGVWYKSSADTVNNPANYAEGSLGMMSQFLGVPISDSLNSDQEMSLEEKTIRSERIKAAFYEANIFELVGEATDTTLQDQPAKAYQFKLNKPEILNYYKAIKEIDGETINEDDVASMTDSIGKIGFETGELIVSDQAVSVAIETTVDESDSYNGSIKASVVLSRFNDPELYVAAPEKSQTFGDLLEGSREQARDARAVSDVKQIMTAAELYYNDAGRYPTKITSGQPIVFKEFTYMSKVPSAVAQAKDSICYNKPYKYKPNAKGTAYTLEYCLEGSSGSIPAGVNVATPGGIFDSKQTNSKTQRAKNLKIRQKQYQDLEKENNRPRPVIAKSNNNIRISNKVSSDIDYLREALKEYYKDAGQYPVTLVSGQPLKYGQITYISKVPAHLQYTDAEICKNAKLIYKAIKTGAKVTDYKLQYCREKESAFLAGLFGTTPAGQLTATKDEAGDEASGGFMGF